GELQCIGATTLDEYRKYIEKDGALDRRFQTIMVEPPTTDETLQIIRGLKSKYEDHHKVEYTDEALQLTIRLSERYMTDRYLPDKAIDVMDEAGSRVRLGSMAIPEEIREVEKELQNVIRKKEKAVEQQEFESAAAFRDTQEKTSEKLKTLKTEWKNAKKEERLVVDEETISDVVSKMTGIPLARLEEQESKKLLKLEEELSKHVVGQEKAISAIARAIRRSRSGLRNIRRPTGSFIFLGPTGVGKTELAKALSMVLFQTQDALVRIDMSEYMEKFAVSRLVGAPPGYVGYEEGGQLTEKVRKKPYSVVLFDEIEKAHADVFNILLQILDDGVLTDSYGRKVNFKNTLIIMTSNAGAREIKKNASFGFSADNGTGKDKHSFMEEKVRQEMTQVFNPEFLNRIDEIIVFRSLNKDDMLKIIDILLQDVKNRLSERNAGFTITKEAKLFIIEKGFDDTQGARPIRRSIQRWIEDGLAEEFLKGKFGDDCHILIDRQGDELIFTEKKQVDEMV
ncbi:MAG: ATP-dependent Clp protease ATP-binding subunit, partial [bacterium]